MLSKNLNKSINSIVFDCPYCNANKITFDIKGINNPQLDRNNNKIHFQLFAVCRSCKNAITVNAIENEEFFKMALGDKLNNDRGTTYLQIVLNYFNEHERDLHTIFSSFFYNPILPSSTQPPEHLPSEIENIFLEASKCLSVNCYNAAGAMFRLCLDITTKKIIDNHSNENPTANDKKTIHSRLKWIFENEILPSDLEDLSRGIKDDGNDAAHDGSLNKDDAEDLLDFTYILLERVYTEPERVKIAAQRRVARRQTP